MGLVELAIRNARLTLSVLIFLMLLAYGWLSQSEATITGTALVAGPVQVAMGVAKLLLSVVFAGFTAYGHGGRRATLDALERLLRRDAAGAVGREDVAADGLLGVGDEHGGAAGVGVYNASSAGDNVATIAGEYAQMVATAYSQQKAARHLGRRSAGVVA